jgi:hypothetical protein
MMVESKFVAEVEHLQIEGARECFGRQVKPFIVICIKGKTQVGPLRCSRKRGH